MGTECRGALSVTFFNNPLFQDKLAELKRQLAQLEEGSHPDWTKKLKRLETTYRERLRINTVIKDLVIIYLLEN
jgi:Sin3 histone deacetylase corepressor complex component SDS3